MTDGYTAEYNSNEVAEPIIDLLVAIMANIVGFATLVGLVLLYVWMRKRA